MYRLFVVMLMLSIRYAFLPIAVSNNERLSSETADSTGWPGNVSGGK